MNSRSPICNTKATLDRGSEENGDIMEQLFFAVAPTSARKRDFARIPLIAQVWHVFLDKTEESSLYREPMTDSQWQTICRKLQRQLKKLDQHQIQWLAGQIHQGIHWLDPHMSAYCQATCSTCGDPCCAGREVFFNRADLLYLASRGELGLPVGQTRTEPDAICRYLGTTGCLLARTQRPYVCVWFLCEPQIQLLDATPGPFQRQLINVLKNTRTCRLKLESLFEELCL
jgi:hypothetical protein